MLFSLLHTPAASASRLNIDLALVGSLPPKAVASAVDEIVSIWAPYGVDLHVVPENTPPDGGLRLAVIVTDRPDERLSADTLGSIRFRGGMPEPVILMYVGRIDMLVAHTPLGKGDSLPAMHHTFVGRVFGRALAHEIGHYLLRSRGHSAIGLMRATHRGYDLVAPERAAFDLSPDDASRVADVAARTADVAAALHE
ncbi:MAG TPA: hypothetical protein VKD69_26980 [Vicinamibacterales bacterium]|nr:hypothetical protein [Vicinamibacterales bacterium]